MKNIDGFLVSYDVDTVKANLTEEELKVLENALPAYFKEEQEDSVHKEEHQNLFKEAHNPNRDIYVVPTQEGADKDDQWNGSIGDATMEHVNKMYHKNLEMENFIHTPNGNIFRIENNVSYTEDAVKKQSDRDILAVMTASMDTQAHDLSKIVFHAHDEPIREWHQARASYNTSATAPLRISTLADKEAVVQFLKEDLALQEEKRKEKTDALDYATVKFEEWEAFPQLTSAIEIPATPTPLYIYAGNSSQIFYDNIPEDHPDLSLINTFLSMANSIDWDYFNEQTVKYFNQWLSNASFVVPFVSDRLAKLALDISTNDKTGPDEFATQALSDIENNWREIVFKKAVIESSKDAILKEIKEFEKSLSFSSGNLHWGKIGKFGQSLFKRYGTSMTASHWSYYKQMKKRFAPEVRIGNLNLNQANFNDLRNLFKRAYKNKMLALLDSDMTDEQYSREMDKMRKEIEKKSAFIYHMLPVMSIKDVMDLGVFTVADIGSTMNTAGFIGNLKRAMKEAIRTHSIRRLTSEASTLIAEQQTNKDKCSEEEWAAVWQVYKICKTEVCNTLGIKEFDKNSMSTT